MYRLEVEQIANNWSFIRQAIVQSYPHHLPLRESVLTEIFKALLTKEMDCWCLSSVDFLTKRAELKAVAITSINRDRISKESFLTIYSLFAFSPVLLTSWKTCLIKLQDFARKSGCTRLLANSDNPRVIRLIKIFGGVTTVHALQLEL